CSRSANCGEIGAGNLSPLSVCCRLANATICQNHARFWLALVRIPDFMTDTRIHFVQAVRERVGEVVVGQEVVVERMMIALLTGGHLLLLGVPGTAKTL